MARPERHDADYFPFYAKRGKTLNILQSKFGLEGIGFFTNLMRFLTLTPDHHYCIKDESDKMNFFAEIGIHDESRGIEMIELMVKTEKLDKGLWEKYRVIASSAFLESLTDAYKQRKNKIITMDEIREKFVSIYGNPVNIHGNPVSIDGNSAKSGVNPQRKGKERKGEESKEFNSGPDEPREENDGSFKILSREPRNDKERVEKQWLVNYQSLFNALPVNPAWSISAPLIKKAVKQVGIEKVLQALETAKTDEFCLMSGYTLKSIMAGNVISRLINVNLSQQRHRIAADNVSQEKVSSYFREAK